ncbi:hypothetical protein Cgig2_032092 [Carnegiea gigantea]|uniref:Aminotransferase-like plant mobile domain-containing protein n=1 Tax=Carnegiea gigantea TaxID=171969 RepID=A0A9Q1JS26_9CARY|nr:hypothetical protein Cgig2_032092 [Carnegiea gigantea]
MGPLEVREGKNSENDLKYAIFLEQWRQRWNIERGGPPVGSMDYAITKHGGHGPVFIIDFIIYVISTCIIRNANGTCHFRVLNNLRNMNEIHNYNWCAYVIQCLNDAVIEWRGDKSKFFTGSLLFLMIRTFYHLIIEWHSKLKRWRGGSNCNKLANRKGEKKAIEMNNYLENMGGAE